MSQQPTSNISVNGSNPGTNSTGGEAAFIADKNTRTQAEVKSFNEVFGYTTTQNYGFGENYAHETSKAGIGNSCIRLVTFDATVHEHIVGIRMHYINVIMNIVLNQVILLILRSNIFGFQENKNVSKKFQDILNRQVFYLFFGNWIVNININPVKFDRKTCNDPTKVLDSKFKRISI